jgi:uncharacterized membrane protein YgdD (TMEM256/DUF423 family)
MFRVVEFWWKVGSVCGALGVAMGAFGAHKLKETYSPRDVEIWNTAAHYQIWHSLAILACTAVSTPQAPMIWVCDSGIFGLRI